MKAVFDDLRRGIWEGAGLSALFVAAAMGPLTAALYRLLGPTHGIVSNLQVALIEQGGSSHQGFFIAMMLSALPIYVGIISSWFAVRIVARDRELGSTTYLGVYAKRRTVLHLRRWTASVIAAALVVAVYAFGVWIAGLLFIRSGSLTSISGRVVSVRIAHSIELQGLITVAILAVVTASATACFGQRFGSPSAFVLGSCLYFSAVFAEDLPGLSYAFRISPFRFADGWLGPLSSSLITDNFGLCLLLSGLWVIGTAIVCVSGCLYRPPRIGEV